MCIFLCWPLALLFGVWYRGGMTNPINTSKSVFAGPMSTENLKVVAELNRLQQLRQGKPGEAPAPSSTP